MWLIYVISVTWLEFNSAFNFGAIGAGFRATHIDESCHTYWWVMSHIWRSHVIHKKESCRTYEGVMSHIWRSHVTHMNESCHTYEWVMSHIWMSHVTHMNESCYTYEWVMSHLWVHLANAVESRCNTLQHPATLCNTQTRGISCVCDMTLCDTSHIRMSHVTYINESCHTYEWDMGWLQLVGSLKSYVSFAEYSLFYSALLQKSPIILRSLLFYADAFVPVDILWGGYD